MRPHKLFPGIRLPEYYPSFDSDYDDELSENQNRVKSLIKAFFELDGNDFIHSLVNNDNFWQKKRERDLLRDLVWHLADDPDSSSISPMIYDGMLSYHLKHNPNYFKDDDDVDIFYEETIDGKISKLEAVITSLKEEIKLLSMEDFAIEQRGAFQIMVNETQDQLIELSRNMESIISQSTLSQQLKNLEKRIGRQSYLFWIIGGILLLAFIS